jgi:hypothetical protein
MAATIASASVISVELVRRVLSMGESGADRKVIARTVGLSLKSVARILSGDDMVGKVSRVISRAGQEFCEGCRQWKRAGVVCKRCERDREIGSRVRSRRQLVELAIDTEDGDTISQAESARVVHNRLAVELPEVVKLPRVLKWDNIEPLRPCDREIVESIAMLVGVVEPAEIDDLDCRWTV